MQLLSLAVRKTKVCKNIAISLGEMARLSINVVIYVVIYVVAYVVITHV